MSMARAQLDLKRLETQAVDLRAKLVAIEAQVEKVRAYIEIAKLYADDAPADRLISPEKKSKGGRPSGGISTQAVETSLAIIRAARKPLHTRDLIRELAARGVVIGGTNPVTNLSGFLSRSPELKNSRTLGWSLAEWPADFPTEPASNNPDEQPP